MNTSRKAEIAKARRIDTIIAAEWAKYYPVKDEMDRIATAIKSDTKMVNYYWNMPNRQANYSSRIDRNEAKLNELRPTCEALRNAAIQLDKDLYEGWNRFFLVQHIHSSQHCSSFRPTTRVGWLPDVSGLTEAEAVRAHGATLCTICFPSAPTELTTKQTDPSLCAGSGQYLDSTKLTGRENSYYSPTGTCRVCGQAVTLTSRNSGKVRKHKGV